MPASANRRFELQDVATGATAKSAKHRRLDCPANRSHQSGAPSNLAPAEDRAPRIAFGVVDDEGATFVTITLPRRPAAAIRMAAAASSICARRCQVASESGCPPASASTAATSPSSRTNRW
jgi:hypothetical protein